MAVHTLVFSRSKILCCARSPVAWSALDVFHDLQSGRYYVQNLDNEENGTSDFGQPLPDANHFSVATLRRVGTR